MKWSSSSSLVTAAVVGLGLTLGVAACYCVSFDKQRRLKKKLQQPKKAKKLQVQQNTQLIQLPDFKDQKSADTFLYDQVKLGENLLNKGETEKGLEHLALAVATCGNPEEALQYLVCNLRLDLYKRLLTKLEPAIKRVKDNIHANL